MAHHAHAQAVVVAVGQGHLLGPLGRPHGATAGASAAHRSGAATAAPNSGRGGRVDGHRGGLRMRMLMRMRIVAGELRRTAAVLELGCRCGATASTGIHAAVSDLLLSGLGPSLGLPWSLFASLRVSERQGRELEAGTAAGALGEHHLGDTKSH